METRTGTEDSRLRPWLVLDVDGVLNNHEAIRSTRNAHALDAECLRQFRRLQVMSGARGVILSSTWRLYPDNRAVLQKAGVHWHYTTPDLAYTKNDAGLYVGLPRRTEIKATLHVVDPDRLHPVIVLDDDSDADLREPWAIFIKTHMSSGLRDYHVNRALEWLAEQEQTWLKSVRNEIHETERT